MTVKRHISSSQLIVEEVLCVLVRDNFPENFDRQDERVDLESVGSRPLRVLLAFRCCSAVCRFKR